jgi:ATP-dependent protease HslVU (ClpYQ) peptidase subunit
MTCIAGLVHEGDVYLAADSEMTWGNGTHSVDDKIITKGDLAIAMCGLAAEAAAVKHRLTLPDLPEDESKHDFWLYVSVPDAIRKCFHDAGILENNSGQATSGGNYIIGWRGRLVSMCSLGGTYPADRGYVANGSGGAVATGALCVLGDESPKKRLRKAVQAACLWSRGVGGKVHVVKVGG